MMRLKVAILSSTVHPHILKNGKKIKKNLNKTNEEGLQAVLDVCLEVNNESEFSGRFPKVERLIYTSDLSTILDYDNF